MSVFTKRCRVPIVTQPYIKLTYIKGTGTQYINTNFKPNSKTRVVLDADVPKTATSITPVLGVIEWKSGQYYQIQITASGTTYVSDYDSQQLKTNMSPKGRMLFDKNKNYCSIDGVQHVNSGSSFQCTATLCLLSGVTTTGTQRIAPGKIYACQIYDNGKLIRDYIPVKMKITGVVGLWDLVNDKFYGNAGTGNFEYYKSEFPDKAYEKVDYIESTNGQYIDTKIYPNQNTKIVIELEGVKKDNLPSVYYGVHAGSGKIWMIGKSSGSSWAVNCFYYNQSKNIGTWDLTKFNTKRTVIQDCNVLLLDGVTYEFNTTTFQYDYTMYLFCNNYLGQKYNMCPMKLYSCKIYNNGIIVRNFIPVRQKNTNLLGLWDMIEGEFYADASDLGFVYENAA